MKVLKITLPNGYSVEQAYVDAALAAGWTVTVEVTELDTTVVPPVMKRTTVPNPVTQEEYGRSLWLTYINERLVANRVKAEAVKLQDFTAALDKAA